MDHHNLAAVSITGTCLDVLGSLYLAYDLLGGQQGPLRLAGPSIVTSNTTLTTFQSDGLGYSALDSSFAALLCNRFSIGWHYWMYA